MTFSPARRRATLTLLIITAFTCGAHCTTATPHGHDRTAWNPCAPPAAACTPMQRQP